MHVSPSNHVCNIPTVFDLDAIYEWLKRDIEWEAGIGLQTIRLNRLWIGSHGRVSFELALQTNRHAEANAYMLQGGYGEHRSRTKMASTILNPRRSHTRAHTYGQRLAGLSLANRDLGVWCCTPDRDRKLRIVADLLDDTRAMPLLAATAAAPVLGLERHDAGVRCEVAAYRATKRCALHVRSSDDAKSRGVFVKVFRRAVSPARIESYSRLRSYLDDRSGGQVGIPELIDSCDKRRFIITAAVTNEARSLGTSPRDISAAAGALAILHDAPRALASRTHAPIDELQTVCRWIPALRMLGKPQYIRLRELAVALGGLRKTIEASDCVLIHRDFFDSQLLRTDESVWLLDFDTLCLGHPEVDMATFVAHLFLDELVAGASTPEVTRKGASFVEGYRRCGGRVCVQRLRFYVSCALARLGGIHLVRGASAAVVDELWRLAEGYANGSIQPT